MAGLLTAVLVVWLYSRFVTRKKQMAQVSALNAEISDLNVQLDSRIKQSLLAQHQRNQFSSQLEEAQEQQEELEEQLAKAQAQIKELQEEVEKNIDQEPAVSENVAEADFSVLKGVGPKLAESLKKAEINSFSELAKMEGDDLMGVLKQAGVKGVSATTIGNLPLQAGLAASKDWEGLTELKSQL